MTVILSLSIRDYKDAYRCLRLPLNISVRRMDDTALMPLACLSALKREQVIQHALLAQTCMASLQEASMTLQPSRIPTIVAKLTPAL
jgi:hypothetical protein